MAIKQCRPVVCYACGLVLGTVESTMGPEGMQAFREQAKALKDQHRCGVQGQEDK